MHMGNDFIKNIKQFYDYVERNMKFFLVEPEVCQILLDYADGKQSQPIAKYPDLKVVGFKNSGTGQFGEKIMDFDVMLAKNMSTDDDFSFWAQHAKDGIFPIRLFKFSNMAPFHSFKNMPLDKIYQPGGILNCLLFIPDLESDATAREAYFKDWKELVKVLFACLDKFGIQHMNKLVNSRKGIIGINALDLDNYYKYVFSASRRKFTTSEINDNDYLNVPSYLDAVFMAIKRHKIDQKNKQSNAEIDINEFMSMSRLAQKTFLNQNFHRLYTAVISRIHNIDNYINILNDTLEDMIPAPTSNSAELSQQISQLFADDPSAAQNITYYYNQDTHEFYIKTLPKESFQYLLIEVLESIENA